VLKETLVLLEQKATTGPEASKVNRELKVT
jgi:hypothetical protein